MSRSKRQLTVVPCSAVSVPCFPGSDQATVQHIVCCLPAIPEYTYRVVQGSIELHGYDVVPWQRDESHPVRFAAAASTTTCQLVDTSHLISDAVSPVRPLCVSLAHCVPLHCALCATSVQPFSAKQRPCVSTNSLSNFP